MNELILTNFETFMQTKLKSTKIDQFEISFMPDKRIHTLVVMFQDGSFLGIEHTNRLKIFGQDMVTHSYDNYDGLEIVLIYHYVKRLIDDQILQAYIVQNS